MVQLKTVGPLAPSFAWDGARLRDPSTSPAASEGRLRGAFATARDTGANRLIVRDPLGLNKLFYAQRGDKVLLAGRPAALRAQEVGLDECRAFPPNTIARWADGTVTVELLWSPETSSAVDTAEDALGAALRRYITAVLAARPGPAVVCLSGGLDSAIVAAAVRERRPDAVAVTFDLNGRDGRSEDFRTAIEVARALELEALPALHAIPDVLALVERVLVAGADWRDFNVHAGLVNAALATTIRQEFGGEASHATVFTGDLANEFVADYEPEHYRGQIYYRLPRLGNEALRTVLVAGLQSAHREIGIFDDFGLVVVQPYAAVAPELLQLPARDLRPGHAKRSVYRRCFGDLLPAPARRARKVRAQIGGQGQGGVLGACVDAGMDQPYLERRFAALHHCDVATVRRFIRAGRHRTGIPGGAR